MLSFYEKLRSRERANIMPFSDEDKVLIKYFRMEKKYSARKLLSEFTGKEWSRSGLDKLLRKIDKT